MNKYLQLLLIPLSIFFIFFNLYIRKATNYNSFYQWDEYPWIGRGYYLELLLNGDFDNPLWQTHGKDGDPKLTSYIYGLSLYPFYLQEKKIREKDYDMVKFLIEHNMFVDWLMNPYSAEKYTKYIAKLPNFIHWERSEAHGKTFYDLINKHGPNFEKTIFLIMKARIMAVIFMTLSVVIVYFFGLLLLKNAFLSFLLSILFGVGGLVMWHSSIAYTEPIFLLLFNIGVIILILTFSRGKFNLQWSVILGAVCALATQVKLNGIMLIFGFNILSVIVLLKTFMKRTSQIRRKIIWSIIIANSSFLAVYVFIDPFLYHETLKRIFFQYRWTYIVANWLTKHFPQYYLPDLYSRIGYIYNAFFNSPNILTPIFIKNIFFSRLILKVIFIFFTLGFMKLSIKTYLEIKKFFLERNFLLSENSIFFLLFLLMLFTLIQYLLLGWDLSLIHI